MGMRRRKRQGEKEAKQERLRIGPVQQKILLLLLGGLALSCTRPNKKSWNIIKGIGETWKDIDRQSVERAVSALYESRLLKSRDNPDGTTTLLLNEKGEKRALTYKAKDMKIAHPKVWDKKWRIVVFDIPEDEREARDSLRHHLTHLGFYKLQQSVAVYPFDCRNEIDFLIELHEIRKYVRFMVSEYIDNEAHLKKFFKLEQ